MHCDSAERRRAGINSKEGARVRTETHRMVTVAGAGPNSLHHLRSSPPAPEFAARWLPSRLGRRQWVYRWAASNFESRSIGRVELLPLVESWACPPLPGLVAKPLALAAGLE